MLIRVNSPSLPPVRVTCQQEQSRIRLLTKSEHALRLYMELSRAIAFYNEKWENQETN